MPSLLANTATTCMSYYLQSQGVVRPGINTDILMFSRVFYNLNPKLR